MRIRLLEGLGAAAVLVTGGLAVAAGGAPPAGQGPQRQVDPRADAQLRRMSDFLARQQAFSVRGETSTDVVLKTGEELSYGGSAAVSVQKPNRLRSDRRDERADQSFFYDGRTLSLLSRDAKVYATTEAPPTLDAMVDFAHDTLKLDIPAADLILSSNAYGLLTDGVQSGTYVGTTVVDGVRCHHLAFRGPETDWQLWIEDGARPVPRKFVIKSKDVVGQPEFVVELRDWNLSPSFPKDHFRFQPPAGASRIDFLGVSRAGEGS